MIKHSMKKVPLVDAEYQILALESFEGSQKTEEKGKIHSWW